MPNFLYFSDRCADNPICWRREGLIKSDLPAAYGLAAKIDDCKPLILWAKRKLHFSLCVLWEVRDDLFRGSLDIIFGCSGFALAVDKYTIRRCVSTFAFFAAGLCQFTRQMMGILLARQDLANCHYLVDYIGRSEFFGANEQLIELITLWNLSGNNVSPAWKGKLMSNSSIPGFCLYRLSRI